jgi:thiamine-phosphate pyrophosphorylase
MLIVVSDSAMRKNETAIINALFAEGLEVFHLRKPFATAEETEQLLHDIDTAHLSKIALHQHHQLADKFGIKRLHYPETKRTTTSEEECLHLQNTGFILSMSVHDLNETLHHSFDYAFYGPVFDSISKQGYTSVVAENFTLPKTKTKWIAIGGIDKTNCTKTLEMGFDGVAVLGAIWQNNDPISEFKKIKAVCSLIVR